MKSTVERKQRLIGVYEGLRTFWQGRTTDADGKPLMVKDLGSLPEPERSRIYRALDKQLGQYAVMEEQRTSRVAAAEGCGYPQTEQSAETDSFEFCKTKRLDAAQAQQPCKQLADLLADHEGVHVNACRERQKPSSAYWRYVVTDDNGHVLTSKYFPPKMITPAGLAAEEIAAYQLEVAALQKIVEKLEKKCRKVSFKNVTIDCVMGSGEGRLRTGQRLEGQTCGDPTKATWTIKQKHFMEARGMPPMPPTTDEFTTDCVEAGGAIEKHYAEVYRRARARGGGGWMCVYRDRPKPQITIRSFRLPMCEGPAEQAVTVDAEISGQCEESKPTPPREPVS